jgi:hypothetical protein
MPDTLQQKSLTNRNVLFLVFFLLTSVPSLVFSGTVIYYRFQQTELEIQELQKDEDYTNERMDKKDNRLLERIEKLEERVTNLEKPNSDK